MNLLKDGFEGITMINFGQPRTGDKAYAAFSNEKLANSQYRVVHYQDPVPHLAPRNPVVDYYHVAYEMYEDLDGSVRQCNSTGEDPTCAD